MLLQELISVFTLRFIGTILGQMEQKNVIHEGISKPYKWLSKKWGLNLLHTMQSTIILWIKFDMYSISFCFICYFAVLWLTFGPLSSEQPLSPFVNHWSLRIVH